MEKKQFINNIATILASDNLIEEFDKLFGDTNLIYMTKEDVVDIIENEKYEQIKYIDNTNYYACYTTENTTIYIKTKLCLDIFKDPYDFWEQLCLEQEEYLKYTPIVLGIERIRKEEYEGNIPEDEEYKIPEKYLKNMDSNFLNEMLHIILIHTGGNIEYGLDAGSGYWFSAFKQACESTKNKDVLRYYNSLDWDIADAFDADLEDMLIKQYRENENSK